MPVITVSMIQLAGLDAFEVHWRQECLERFRYRR